MNHNTDSVMPPIEGAMAIINGELSSKRRWVYRTALLGAFAMLALVVGLWTTEPGPLPPRLHIAFGSLSLVAVGWIVVLTWILTRRNCPSALDRIATGWMATVASSLFLIVGLGICLVKSDSFAALNVGMMGAVFLIAAIVILRSAYAQRTRLKEKLAELGQRSDG